VYRRGIPIALFLACALPFLGAAPSSVALRAGMVIDRSVTIRPGLYRLSAAADLSKPAIVVRGSNVTIDFAGATLAGGPDEAEPDTYAGVGLLVDGGTGVTIKNAVIRGYKVGILARGTTRLHLTRNDLSFNWKQRLYSGVEHESLVDWMSYHNNEKDEWLRYGAAVYLDRCPDAEIDHNTVTQGQNGLMLTRSDGAKIWNNSIAFLSGIGIGLYRSSRGVIAHNRVDWCVRGYSHGFYNRGQDSAGILMYEQSSGNRIVRNSVTHGGDGLFLWAGQSTMETGQGGSNDNVFYGNDFSHAPANGIETTFSRNTFIENSVEDNWHGVWGGYSYDSMFIQNRFARNTEAIAIEHGQRNVIASNTFDGDETAISLWQNATQDPGWGYPKHRDTASHGYRIEGNTLTNVKTAFKFRDTRDVLVSKNTYEKVETIATLFGLTPNVTFDASRVGDGEPGVDRAGGPERPALHEPPLEGGMDPVIPPSGRRGREHIIVDEWGPYDFRSPKLWPAGRSDAVPLKLRVLGPDGSWKLARAVGASVDPAAGRTSGEMVVTPSPTAGGPIDFEIELEYRGADVVSPRGARVKAGDPYRFGYRRFFAPVAWTVRFFTFDEAVHPLSAPDAFRKVLDGEPAKTLQVDRLDYMSGRSILEGLPRDRVAIVAEGEVTLPESSDYELLVISDDGVRVWVDGALAIDRWTEHESIVDRVPIRAGRRGLKVEYFELTGFAELRVEILKARARR
jgi:nitrous oxidase accessory protein NosD